MNCYNGGYTNPNNCYQCKCPSGLGGKDCLSVEKSSNFFLILVEEDISTCAISI